jgi:hypothetical protein
MVEWVVLSPVTLIVLAQVQGWLPLALVTPHGEYPVQSAFHVLLAGDSSQQIVHNLR